jgi:hypothetical protein
VHEPEKDKITAHDFKKLRAMKKTPDGKVHSCATHVEHVVLGKGITISEQHAEPDTNGDIEWYTVQFENSVQKVLTKDFINKYPDISKKGKNKARYKLIYQHLITEKTIPNILIAKAVIVNEIFYPIAVSIASIF